MNNNIEIESNKRMRTEHMHPITLTFKEDEMEEMYHQVRADLLKSNVVCTCVIWLFITICQSIVIQDAGVLAPTFAPATVVLGAGLLLVMAEEFPKLCTCLRRMSMRLARATLGRKVFIFSLIAVIAVPSMLTLLLVEPNCKTMNKPSNFSKSEDSLQAIKGNAVLSNPILSIGQNGFSFRRSLTSDGVVGDRALPSQALYSLGDRHIPEEVILEKNKSAYHTILVGRVLDLVSGDLANLTTLKGRQRDTSTLRRDKKSIEDTTRNLSYSNVLSVGLKKVGNSTMLPVENEQEQSAVNVHNSERTSETSVGARTRNRRHGSKQLIEIISGANQLHEEVSYTAQSNKGSPVRNEVINDKATSGKFAKEFEAVGTITKEMSRPFRGSTSMEEGYKTMYCQYPQYWVYTWVLCMVALASFLKLNYLAKTVVLVFMVTCYTILITRSSDIFNTTSNNDISLTSKMLVLLVLFFFMVSYHGRLVEITSRLDFVWKQQALRELTDMSECRQYNTQLLKNILPDHVANYFLSEDRKGEDLFSKAYENVGVLFASIPNFTQFYSEDVNRGMECIRLLNEIIADFDELLDEDRFTCIEKIKTIGSTYMAASGLNPTEKDAEDAHAHLCALVDFALEMKARLEDVNTHSFNNFKLRVGISHGPLVGGVIGAKKPVFDVWGNTVNEASRMDSTGATDMIQIPKETAQILNFRGFRLQYRGRIAVKGKGEMDTYFVVGRRASSKASFSRQPSTYNSLAAVVYGMVQARKKQTIKRSNTTVKRERPRKISPYDLSNSQGGISLSQGSSGLGTGATGGVTPALSRKGKTAVSIHNLRSFYREANRSDEAV